MRRGVLFALVVLPVACSSPTSAPEPAQAPAPAAAPVSVADDSDDELARRLSAAAREIENLQAQVANQEQELQTAHTEIERWKGGLDKCVAKLNEVSADASALSASAYAPPVSSGARRGGSTRVSTLGAPTISVTGDGAVVSVRLWNAGDADAAGNVEIELVVNGEVIDSTSEYVEISPRTDQVLTVNLSNRGREGNYSARVHLGF